MVNETMGSGGWSMNHPPRTINQNFLTRKFSGGHSERETPVPIPNTEVKPPSVDGTAWVTGWESRTLPGIKNIALFKKRAFYL